MSAFQTSCQIPHFTVLFSYSNILWMLLYEFSTNRTKTLKRAGFSIFTHPCPFGNTCSILRPPIDHSQWAWHMLCRDCGSFRTVEERSITNTFTNHFKGCSTFPTHCGRVSTKRGTSRLCTKAATWKKKKKIQGERKSRLYFSNPFFRQDLEMWLGTD